MCSELLRIPITWNGVPIFGFGVVLLAWLALGAWAMVSTARQGGWPAAAKAHLPTVLIVAALIALVVPRVAPNGVPLRAYGLLVLLGIVAGILLAIRRAIEAGLDVDDILGLALWVIPGGAIGGRLFYVIQYWGERIRQSDTWDTIRTALAFTEGGLVVYGAFFGAMAGFAFYVWRHKLPALAMADIMAPAMMVGLALGRIGCLLNGCCYGGESDAPWAITFPRENAPSTPSPVYAEQASEGRFYGIRVGEKAAEQGDDGPPIVIIASVDAGSPAAASGLRAGDVVTRLNVATIDRLSAAHLAIFDAVRDGRSLAVTTPDGVRTIPAIEAPARSLPVHPAQIYSAIDAALLAWVLWSYYPYRRRDGEVMALMVTIHPVSRFLLEEIRVDEPPAWGTGLSISQNLSGILFCVGLALWAYLRWKTPARLAFPLPEATTNEPRLATVR